MRINPHLSKRSLVTGMTVAAMAVAGTVAFTVAATPSNAATCNGYVGLTFDDGPSNDHTPALLNALRQNGLRATLFNEGQYAAAYPAQVQAEVNAGMWVGNHSYTHPHLTQESQSQIDSEVSRTQQAIANAGGGTPKLFRPPYGETNSTLKTVEAKYGLTEIVWDIDSQDWNGASTDAIVQANSRLTNGQIILMHEWPANTLAAIPRIAQMLASKGLCAGMISPQTGRAVAPDGGSGGGGTTPPPGGGGDGTCTVSVSAGQAWSDRFNVNFSVSGSSNWVVTIGLHGSQSLQNSWNASVSGTSGTLTARPNGSGNNFGITLYRNGTDTMPTASCSSSGSSGGGGSTGGGGTGSSCTVSVSAGQAWSDRFNVNFSVSGSSNWVVTIGLHGSQSLQNSWNASVSGTSGTLTARPNGSGNNFGITLYKNGNTTMPTASCGGG